MYNNNQWIKIEYIEREQKWVHGGSGWRKTEREITVKKLKK